MQEEARPQQSLSSLHRSPTPPHPPETSDRSPGPRGVGRDGRSLIVSEVGEGSIVVGIGLQVCALKRAGYASAGSRHRSANGSFGSVHHAGVVSAQISDPQHSASAAHSP